MTDPTVKAKSRVRGSMMRSWLSKKRLADDKPNRNETSSDPERCCCGTDTNKPRARKEKLMSSKSFAVRRNGSTEKSSPSVVKQRRTSSFTLFSSFSSKRAVSLADLIEKRDWKTLRDLLDGKSIAGAAPPQAADPKKGEKHQPPPPPTIEELIEAADDSMLFTGENVMHVACRAHAPADIVERLLEARPDLSHGLDCVYRTPLHVAAGWGASPSVVDALLRSNRRAASRRDVHGQYPLHLACEMLSQYVVGPKGKKKKKKSKHCFLADNGKGEEVPGPLPEVIRSLTSSMQSNSKNDVCIDDDDDRGMSAIDYALDGGVDDDVIQILTTAAGGEAERHARRRRQRMQRQIAEEEKQIADALFECFGIEESSSVERMRRQIMDSAAAEEELCRNPPAPIEEVQFIMGGDDDDDDNISVLSGP